MVQSVPFPDFTFVPFNPIMGSVSPIGWKNVSINLYLKSEVINPTT